MPLVNNKVGDDVAAGTEKAPADEQALVESFMKVRQRGVRGASGGSAYLYLCLRG